MVCKYTLSKYIDYIVRLQVEMLHHGNKNYLIVLFFAGYWMVKMG